MFLFLWFHIHVPNEKYHQFARFMAIGQCLSTECCIFRKHQHKRNENQKLWNLSKWYSASKVTIRNRFLQRKTDSLNYEQCLCCVRLSKWLSCFRMEKLPVQIYNNKSEQSEQLIAMSNRFVYKIQCDAENLGKQCTRFYWISVAPVRTIRDISFTKAHEKSIPFSLHSFIKLKLHAMERYIMHGNKTIICNKLKKWDKLPNAHRLGHE